MESRRLTNLNDFNVEDMIFSEPKNTGNFKKIVISTKHSDGTSGKLITPVEECFSFGVQISDRYDTYSMPLVFKNGDQTVKVLGEILQKCKDHMSEENLGKCLYEKLERGTTTIYPELQYYNGVFNTKIFEKDVKVSPLKYLNVKCNVRAAICVECILVGNTISLQFKIYEAGVTPVEKERKRILPAKRLLGAPARI